MPRGLVIVTVINALLVSIIGLYLVSVFYAGETVRTLNFVCSWIALAGLLASLVGTFVRTRFWHVLARGALYAIMIGFGVQIMAMIPELLNPTSLASAAVLFVLIVYLVGARGYLNSTPARQWFRLPPAPASEKQAPATVPEQ
jgi:hypothetical protein